MIVKSEPPAKDLHLPAAQPCLRGMPSPGYQCFQTLAHYLSMNSGPFTEFPAIALSLSQELEFKTLRTIFSFSPSSLLSFPYIHKWMNETTIDHGFPFFKTSNELSFTPKINS